MLVVIGTQRVLIYISLGFELRLAVKNIVTVCRREILEASNPLLLSRSNNLILKLFRNVASCRVLVVGLLIQRHWSPSFAAWSDDHLESEDQTILNYNLYKPSASMAHIDRIEIQIEAQMQAV